MSHRQGGRKLRPGHRFAQTDSLGRGLPASLRFSRLGLGVFAGVALRPYTGRVSFRDRILASLESMQPVLEIPGILIGGSQVPNLLQPDLAATLVVTQDIDLVVPVSEHAEVKRALGRVEGYSPSADEPSVWLPDDPAKLEINFIGRDPATRETAESYVLDDLLLPLLVFGLLSHLVAGQTIEIAAIRARLPRPAGLVIEKLLTERAGIKGDRDLLVALGLIVQVTDDDVQEVVAIFRSLTSDQRESVLANLAVLSLLGPIPGMPDPVAGRTAVVQLLDRLEGVTSR